MKKTLMTVAIALSALVAMPAMAKNPNNNNQQCDRNPYAGIELTTDQQAALQNIDNTRREQRQQRDQANAESRDQRKESRKQARRDYLNQVKQVLTPDQYVIFLENIVVDQPNGGGRAQARDGRRDGRKGHGQHQGQRQGQQPRGERGQRPAANTNS